MIIGIYKLYNVENGRTYINQSKSIENRRILERKTLKDNKHIQKELQEEFNQYKDRLKDEHKGSGIYDLINFDKSVFDKYYKFEVIEEFETYDKKELLKIEDEYIIQYRHLQEGYSQRTNLELGLTSDKIQKPKKKKKQTMKINNLEVGQIIPNYRKLCKILGIKITTGESKINQIKELEKLCCFKKSGNKYIIEKIY